MDHRQELIDQVKDGYARIADIEGRETYASDQFNNLTAEAYYEKLLEKVIGEIESGAYDHFDCGQDIIESIANK
jgi:hypothetical protein